MVKEANSPMRGSTPAMMEKAMASGIKASATTRPARTSVFNNRGDFRVRRTDWRSVGLSAERAAVVLVLTEKCSTNSRGMGASRRVMPGPGGT
ncbi:hypothetical protein GCM10007173_33670 [Glutamicibacter ardleyensis]|uniref:Uncharacterized protein n=1 Tax=Glutamicibacter ardleyensis TaxID=225894 RepID=A0ABQ2DT55_9MICC|nr:hypothetical protein GCM10007173_33670 [Glutamicibacter ardleyensis]